MFDDAIVRHLRRRDNVDIVHVTEYRTLHNERPVKRWIEYEAAVVEINYIHTNWDSRKNV